MAAVAMEIRPLEEWIEIPRSKDQGKRGASRNDTDFATHLFLPALIFRASVDRYSEKGLILPLRAMERG
jgi:hypothetical protein